MRSERRRPVIPILEKDFGMPPQVEEQQNEQEQSPPKSSGKKKLLIPLIALVLLGGGGTGAYLKFFHSSGSSEAKTAPETAVIKDMDTLIVNLADSNEKRYLKVTMKAKLNSKAAEEEFTARNFEMRDIILMILSGKSVDDVATPEDKLQLKQDLITSLNHALKKGQVQDIYFTEFLIQ